MKRNIRSMFLSKLVLSYSLVILLVLLAVSVGFYVYLSDVNSQVIRSNQNDLIERTLRQVDSFFDEMNKLADQVNSDDRIVSKFEELHKEGFSNDPTKNFFDDNLLDNLDLGSALTSLNGATPTVWRISVYNDLHDYISGGATVESFSNVDYTLSNTPVSTWMNQLSSPTTRSLITAPTYDKWCSAGNQAKYFSMIRPLSKPYYEDNAIGLIEVQQDLDTFVEKVDFGPYQDGQDKVFYLFDDQGNQILPEDVAYPEDVSKMQVYERTSSKYKWQVRLVQSNASVESSSKPILFYLLFIEVVIAAVLIMAIYFISRKISAPLLSLSNTVNSITIDNISSEQLRELPKRKDKDEIYRLQEAFITMIERLDESVKYEKKAYLLALQSQMDPHFLYNMLAVLSSIGMEEGSDKIVETCARMSRILRYISTYHDGNEVTVADEIRNVQDYLELMKTRYEEYFSFEVQTDGRIDQMPMPRLTLQPVIENCFKHGFTEIEPPWEIKIAACIRGNRWYIEIVDNGKGFERESIDKIKNKIEEYTQNLQENYQEMKIGGLGVVNTVVRLRLVYGENVNFYVYNIRPHGACITLEGDLREGFESHE